MTNPIGPPARSVPHSVTPTPAFTGPLPTPTGPHRSKPPTANTAATTAITTGLLRCQPARGETPTTAPMGSVLTTRESYPRAAGNRTENGSYRAGRPDGPLELAAAAFSWPSALEFAPPSASISAGQRWVTRLLSRARRAGRYDRYG